MADDTAGSVSIDIKANLAEFDSGVDEATKSAEELEKAIKADLTAAIDEATKRFGELGQAASDSIKGLTDSVANEMTAAIAKTSQSIQELIDKSADAGKAAEQLESYFAGKTRFTALPPDMQVELAAFNQQLEDIAQKAVEVGKGSGELAEEIKHVGEGAEEATFDFWKLTAAFGLGASAADAITELFKKMVDSIGESINAASLWEAQTAGLTRQLENAGYAAGTMLAQINALGQEMHEVQGVRAAYSALLQFQTINQDVFPELIKLSEDLATQAKISGTGLGNMAAVAKLLGRSFQDPITAMGRLQQSGIALDPLTRTMIKHFAELGDTAKAQSLFLEALRRQVGGLAEATDSGLAGALKRYNNAVETSKAVTGGFYIELLRTTGLLEKETAFLERHVNLSGLLGPVTELQQKIKDLEEEAKGLGKMWDPFGIAAARIKEIQQELPGLQSQLNAELEKGVMIKKDEAVLSQQRVDAVNTLLEDEFNLVRMGQQKRVVEERLRKLQAEGYVVGQKELDLARERLLVEQQFARAKQLEVNFATLSYQQNAALARLRGDEAAAKEEEFKAEQEAFAIREREAGSSETSIRSLLEIRQRLFNLQKLSAGAGLVRGLEQENEMLEAQAAALKMGSVEAAAFLREKQLLLQAEQQGIVLTDEETANLKEQAAAYGEVTRSINELRTQLDLAFETQTMFMTDTEQRVAQTLRSVYGEDWPSYLDSAIAQQTRFNERLKQAEGIAQSFASGFVSDLMAGTTAMEALTASLKRLAEQLIDLAMNMAIRMMFQGLAGSLGGGAPMTGWDATVTPAAKGLAWQGSNIIPLAQGGVISQPTMLAGGAAVGGEAGIEGVFPLKRGPTGELGVMAHGVGGGSVNNITIINKAPDTQVTKKESQNDQGGLDIEVLIDQMFAKNAGRPGTSTNRLLGTMGAALPGVRR